MSLFFAVSMSPLYSVLLFRGQIRSSSCLNQYFAPCVVAWLFHLIAIPASRARELGYHCLQRQASTSSKLDDALTLPTTAPAAATATTDNSRRAVAVCTTHTHNTANIFTRTCAHDYLIQST